MDTTHQDKQLVQHSLVLHHTLSSVKPVCVDGEGRQLAPCLGSNQEQAAALLHGITGIQHTAFRDFPTNFCLGLDGC